jgi:hypothetical protein
MGKLRTLQTERVKMGHSQLFLEEETTTPFLRF